MKRSVTRVCLITAISLLFGVIWQGVVSAAVAPVIEPLGQITGKFRVPTKLDIDSAGNLYIVDARNPAIFKYDKYGNNVATITGIPSSGAGLAVTPDGSRIYVACRDKVAVFEQATKIITYLGSGAGEFVSAGEIDLDAQGFVIVADEGDRTVKVYDPSGKFQYGFGGLGTADNQLWVIRSLSVDPAAGEVYVADPSGYTGDPRIKVFDLAGGLKRILTYTMVGTTPYLAFPAGMTFDLSGRGYFLDSFHSDLRVLSLPATYLSSYAVSGLGPGELSRPSDVAFDPLTSRLFVSCGGARIEIFGVDGGQNPAEANAAPGLPTPVSPIADSEAADAMPVLEYANAVDPDGDALTYDVQVFLDQALVAEYLGLPEGQGSSFAQVDVALEENTRYQWAVQAFDGRDASGWTEQQSFYVNAVEEAPFAPAPVSPLAGEVLDGDGLLSWQAAADPDPFDTVSYVVEISDDASFGTVSLSQAVDGTSATLGALTDYPALADSGTYFWRVKAVDNHGLESAPGAAGSFSYDTTILKVTANMPGAKVYLGGNYGYPGRFAGDAPQELRDFPAGPCSVVVERAGFEPFVAQIYPAYRENLELYVKLVPALSPVDLKARPLAAGGQDIAVSGGAAPFVVDFDNDGLNDLLVGDGAGAVTLYPGTLTAEGEFYYAAGTTLAGLPVIPGAVPFVADWQNDGRKDLLIGGADGSVSLCANVGTEDAPGFGSCAPLHADGAPIAVPGAAIPAVIEGGDGGVKVKALAVGTFDANAGRGRVLLFRNAGTDDAPNLTAAGELFSMPSAGPVAPFFADWDGDGQRELLAAADEHIYLCEKQAGGQFAAQQVLSVAADLLGPGNGNSAGGAYSLGRNLRLFACDTDGARGKDLLVGNGAGEVRLVRSFGSDLVPAFTGALLAKTAQIAGMISETTDPAVAADSASLSGQVAAIEAEIQAGDLKTAGHLAHKLAGSVPAGTDLAKAVAELEELLK